MKCRVVDRQEDGNGDSGGSFQNGHAQLMVVPMERYSSSKTMSNILAMYYMFFVNRFSINVFSSLD